VRLDGVEEPLILTRVRTLELEDASREAPIRACLRRYEGFARPVSPLVERVGVNGESLTVKDLSGFWLLGCDSSAGPAQGDGRWCGAVPGRLYDDRLRDPRLSIASCTTSDGEPVGFAWIQPGPSASYVAVAQRGYAEAYEVAAGLPVRVVTTTDISVEESGARFDVSEHDADGGLLREYELDARVAG
jgi:hypothetical protein